ncbi:hypothetical protein [Nocardioides solisilvae]|uniref:hypothetical protein n=1 Tax=Nocardioides solisilvae TaxID=1542435 RepID=UPI000D7417E2|nr:hypothetical protein [Nocardioides solisilvae]
MTTVELLRRLLRRWYVVAAGLVATAAVAAAVASPAPLFVSRVDVVLVAPPDDTLAPELVSRGEDLIALAGLVERLVNEGRPREPGTAQVVPLEGTGVRRGVQVTLPNAGGQWDHSFVAPVLDVQAVGTSRAEVVALRDDVLDRVVRTLRQTQADDGVPPRRRATARVVPEDGPVVPAGGHPTRAAAAAGVVGLLLTALAGLLVDGVLVRRRARRS